LFSSEDETLLGEYADKYIRKVFGNSSNISSRIHGSQSFRLFIFALLIAAFIVLRFLLIAIGASINRVSLEYVKQHA
jgi:hypothetical protein